MQAFHAVTLVFAVLVLSIRPPELCAQEPSPKPAEVAKGEVRELEPDTYLLEDEQGQLQAVLNFSYQAFVKARRMLQGLEEDQAQPRFSLQTLKITGHAKQDRAALKVELGIRLHRSNWVRVPIGMQRAVLAKPLAKPESGARYLDFEPGAGYVLWLRADEQPDAKADEALHQVELELLVPIEHQGELSTLKLQVPRATHSELALEVAMAKAVGRLVEGGQLQAAKAQGNNTLFSALGLDGLLEFSWHSAERQGSTAPTALEATGDVVVRVNGPNIRSEARLLVRSFGGQFDTFRVRLPPQATLVQTVHNGYSVAQISAADENAADRGREVEVRLDEPTGESLPVRITVDRSLDLSAADKTLEMAGFQVVDAVRQWGHVAVVVRDDWQVLWGQSRNVRQVEEVPEALSRERLAAAFEYFSQPFSLPARVIPRSTQTRVEPEYLVHVDANRTVLQGKLRYSIRGAKVFAFTIAMQGWKNVEVGPDHLVDKDGVVITDEGELIVPLKRPSTQPVTLELAGVQPVEADAERLQLVLPVPRATSSEPAMLVVQPADNVELVPLADKMVGLLPQHVAPEIELPVRQQEPLYYRAQAEQASFVAQMTVHPQEITVETNAQIAVSKTTADIRQRIVYRVRHEPIDHVDLRLPAGLAVDGRAELIFEGNPLPFKLLEPVANQEQPSPATMVRVALPPPARIGTCNLLVRYQHPLPRLEPRSTVREAVPLVVPIEGQFVSAQVTVKPESGLRTKLGKNDSQAAWLAGPAGSSESLVLQTKTRAAQVPLILELEDRSDDGATLVHRLWVQTWLNGSARQDRVVYRFTSTASKIRLRLPSGVTPDEVEVLLDGALQAAKAVSGTLVVSLPSGDLATQHHLELRYHLFDQPPRGALQLASVQMLDSQWNGQTYWQLVLPPREAVLSAAQSFTQLDLWDRESWLWSRRPVLSDQQLEAWAGAKSPGQIPASATRYLFFSLDSPPVLQVHTASRGAVLFVISGITLAVGLLLVYLPVARRPAVLVALAMLLLVAGVSQPDLAIQVGRAATVGVVLVLLAGLLRYVLLQQKRRRPASGPISSMILTPSAVESVYESGGSSPSSAATTVALHPTESNR